MINITKLRIGNLISERGNHRIYPVSEILKYGVRVKYFSCGKSEIISQSNIMPVLLSEDMLLKAGFNNKKQAEEFIKEQCMIVICVDCWPYIEEITGAELQYVHELQNLFTSIYKTELQITI